MVKGEFSGKPTNHTRDQRGETGETQMGGLWLKKSLSLQLGRILVMRGGEETLLVGNRGDRERGVAMKRKVERGGVRVGTQIEKSWEGGGRGGIVLWKLSRRKLKKM